MGHRLSSIYTRTGDDGTTGLGDGKRVRKDDARVEAYGTVDEANSTIGCHHVGGTMKPQTPAIAAMNAIEARPAANSASVGVPVAGSVAGAITPGITSNAGLVCCPKGQMIHPFSYGGPPGTKNVVGKCHPTMRSAVSPILSNIS